MKLNPYLLFDGKCEEAFKTYQKVLGGEIVAMIPHEGTRAEESVAPEWRKKIIHAMLVGNGMVLMGSEAPPDRYQPMTGRWRSMSRSRQRPSVSSMRLPKTEPYACRSARRSSPSSLAC